MRPLYSLDFQLARNEDWDDVFVLADEAGTAIDLTDATFEMDVRDAAGALKIKLTSAAGTLLVRDAAAGLFGPLLPRAQLAPALPAGTYVHDCLMVAGGRTRRIWTGRLTVQAGITEPTP